KYSPSEVRATMKFKTQMLCDRKIPRWYQEDSGDAFMLGMDVVLVSATGSGKTLAFLQGLLADTTEQSKLVIISPLNELEYDMVERCNKMGLPALAVNGDMWAKDSLLHKHPVFSSMMRNAEWTKNIIGTVIDEAHCVLEWKDQF
ncbi:P-loop containing nucleoside triphosphate hydrolase protein, partial [Irpex rosettiformis]